MNEGMKMLYDTLENFSGQKKKSNPEAEAFERVNNAVKQLNTKLESLLNSMEADK